MRTTDMVLMGFFGPAAVTAVGLGDVWDRIVLRIGLGLGAGSIALISQESGAEEHRTDHNSDTVLTQVLITGALAGLPFIFVGWLIPDTLIGLLGPEADVVLLAAEYLRIIFSAAPFRITSLIGARALQGTGDTKTPMVVGVGTNAINIGLSIALVSGFGPFPQIGVPGVGWGTAVANLLASAAYIAIFMSPRTNLGLHIPRQGWDFIITRQLITVSIPRILQGGYQSLIAFPFNALVLLFGTEAAAAYHITRRIQQQVTAPMQRAYHTVTTILVGQNLGRGEHAASRRAGKGMLWLAGITIGVVGAGLFVFSPRVVRLFTDDPHTLAHGVAFLRALSIGAPIFSLYNVLAGLLTGAGDTRTPFYASLGSQTVLMLGLSYFLSVQVGLGITGILIGLIADYLGRSGWVANRFRHGAWISDAEQMIKQRRAQSGKS